MPRRKKTLPIPVLLTIGGGLLLITAAFMMALQNTPAPAAPAASSNEHEEDTYPEIPRATLDEAKAAVDAGSAILVDVRDAGSFAESHIPGALSIPLSELEQRLGELDRSQWIITYCTWPAEESSARAARILLDNGFEKITPILGGFRAWQQAAYPVEP